MTYTNILHEAENIVNGDRNDDYGDVNDSFRRISRLWGAYLGIDVNCHDVAHMMILLKISRAKNGYHHDSYLDGIGYFYCADKLDR